MKVADVELTVGEFFWKLAVVLLLVVPVFVGGLPFASYFLSEGQETSSRGFLWIISAVVGLFISIVVTSAIIKIGHKAKPN